MPGVMQLAPLMIFIPLTGALINFFWGSRLGEKVSGFIGSAAAILSFLIAATLFFAISGLHGEPFVIDPPFLDGWIRIESIQLDIPWQIRVDTLSVVMMLVVTGVGSLIHVYSTGYMHGDPKFSRFFAYLNLFLAFMLTLVMANNFLMMFVGWEGVGLSSFLLIGFWWDKGGAEGLQKGRAALKAMITNRVGDFGMIMAIFLIFWTFGTLDYYRPGEVANTLFAQELAHAAEEGEAHSEEDAEDHGAEEDEEHGEAVAGTEEEHVEEEDGHGAPERVVFTDNEGIDVGDLGVFGQTLAFVELPEDETLVYQTDDEGNPVELRGRMVDLGPFEVEFETMLIIITLFMLVGVTAKSAQIPLFVWLPDAMAGPTPVSALIHAATMVTAGVFLMVRSSVFLDHAELTSLVIAVIGAVTALMAGYIALGQWDIKAVLAYSTVSQLGFMVAAIGLGAYVAAMFHLVTHAFFKATLFLGSGSVIHGVEHGHHRAHERHGNGEEHSADHDEFDPQDMRNMGGLAKKMPITFIAYLIATLALAGIFPLAGFWSKDEILADAFHAGIALNELKGMIVLVLLIIAAAFTAFYMWRQIEMVFFGRPRSRAAELAPESARSMTVVLVILALLSIFGGFINIPKDTPIFDQIFKTFEFKHFLEPVIPSVTIAAEEGEVIGFNIGLAVLATVVALVAILLARLIFGNGRGVVNRDEHHLGQDVLQGNLLTRPLFALSNARLYWDELYNFLFIRPFKGLARFLADIIDWQFFHDYFHNTIIKGGFDGLANMLSNPIDLGIIDGIVNGVGAVTRSFSGRLRKAQTGYVRMYAVALLFGVVTVIILMLIPLLENGS